MRKIEEDLSKVNLPVEKDLYEEPKEQAAALKPEPTFEESSLVTQNETGRRQGVVCTRGVEEGSCLYERGWEEEGSCLYEKRGEEEGSCVYKVLYVQG